MITYLSSPETQNLEDLYRSYFSKKIITDENLILIEMKNGEFLSLDKDILTIQSPVFQAMLSNPMQESLSNTIQLNKYEPEIVKAFFEYLLYRRHIVISTNFPLYFELLEMTHMYQITDYYDSLLQTLCDKCTINNSYEMITLCQQYPELSDKIYDKCYRLIKEEFYQYITTETICYDDIGPGELTSKGSLRPADLDAHVCCKHKGQKKEYLKEPNKFTNVKGRYLCITYTVEKRDPKDYECIKSYCCEHRDDVYLKRHQLFLNLPADIQQKVIKESLGETVCDLIKKIC
jgi:hypothetical protein